MKDGENGQPNLSHPRQIVGFGVHAASDGDCSLLPGETAKEGGVP